MSSGDGQDPRIHHVGVLARFGAALPPAHAILTAAGDLRRVGVPNPLPGQLIVAAALDHLHEDPRRPAAFADGKAHVSLLKQALHDLTTHDDVSLVREVHPQRPQDGPSYELGADLETHLIADRRFTQPPDSIWSAVEDGISDPGVLDTVAGSARARGRYLPAERLYRRSAAAGSVVALRALAWLREQAHDTDSAEGFAHQAARAGDPHTVGGLVWWREQSGDHAGADRLARQAADHGDSWPLTILTDQRRQAGSPSMATLADRAAQAAGHDLDAIRAATWWRETEQIDLTDSAEPVIGLRTRARKLERAGDHDGAHECYLRGVAAGDTLALYGLVALHGRAGDLDAATRTRFFGITATGEPAAQDQARP